VYDREPRDVRQISNLFRTDWDRLPASFNAPNLMLSPDNARPKLLALLASARTTVDIDDEEVADPGVERALTRLARRGVAVRLLMPWGASLPAASVLLRGHVAVRELRSPYVHAKLVCVDRTEAYAGSENFSTASLDRNRELGILLRGPVVARLERVFAADWRRAAPPPLR
jgi:phosphatidylserine/phosphatidylglycerophosphate/cardiolipin synthase-like enzyme